jgi:hypothetical protein
MRAIASASALLAGYLALVLGLTWPLASALTTRIVGLSTAFAPFDAYYSAWALSYVGRRLLTAPSHLGAANIYHPAADALFYGPAGLGALPFFAPPFFLTHNPALALNSTLIGGLAMTAWTLHLVVRRWTDSSLAGAIAAATFLTSDWATWHFIPTAPHVAALQFAPLIAFLGSRPISRPREAVLLFFLVVVQCLTEPTYVAPAILAALAVAAAAPGNHPRGVPETRPRSAPRSL